MDKLILSWWNWLWGNTANTFIFPDAITSNFTFDTDALFSSAEIDGDYEYDIKNDSLLPERLVNVTPTNIAEILVSFGHSTKFRAEEETSGGGDLAVTTTTFLTSTFTEILTNTSESDDVGSSGPFTSTVFDYELGYNYSTPDFIANLTYFNLRGSDNLYPLTDENNESIFNIIINCTFGNATTDSLLKSNDSINCTTNDFPQYNYETTLRVLGALATAIILGVIILATVVGNVFVIAAILLERHLQSVANYLILSLAVADLLVACLVMPLSAVYEVSQEWKLGPELCDMWTSCDVLCCTASILHLVAIALDRYWAVTNIDYIHQRTAKRIGFMILIIWGLSFFVSIAPLLGWKDPEWEERVSRDSKCIISQDIGYQIFATASSFYVPLFIILILYWRIFQTARKRIRRRQQAQTHPEPLANASCLALTAVGFRWKVNAAQSTSSGMVATAAGGSGGIAAAVVTIIGRPLPTISETTTAFTNISSTHTSPEKGSYGNGVDRIENDPPTADISNYTTQNPTSSSRPVITRKKTQISVDSKRERKAAKTLAIITGAFVCCWLPFFILAILLPTCDCDISPLAMSLSLWLGYFNSTLNPIIYTIFSPEFRHAFKRILCGRRSTLRRREKCIRR